MIARESRYFLRSFWQEMCGREVPDGIDDEFQEIASQAAGNGPDVFLHRDFQSRNIMIKDGAVRFIDYQGGRLGPPGYDLASLLIDPYMGLSAEFQEEMLHYYLDVLSLQQSVDQPGIQASVYVSGPAAQSPDPGGLFLSQQGTEKGVFRAIYPPFLAYVAPSVDGACLCNLSGLAADG